MVAGGEEVPDRFVSAPLVDEPPGSRDVGLEGSGGSTLTATLKEPITIPGGGHGMGPIAVAPHLAPFLADDPHLAGPQEAAGRHPRNA